MSSRIDKLSKIGILLAICYFILLMPHQDIFAAVTGKIAGKVTDDAGTVLPGANIIIEGTNEEAPQTATAIILYSAFRRGTMLLKL